MSGGVPVQQFDMDVLRAAEKGDPHPGSDRLGLDAKFGALLFELGDDPVDPVDTQADMLKPEIRRLRRRGHGLLGRNLRDENSHPSEIEVEARPAVRLHRANDLGAEHVLIPARGRLRIRAAQMDVVVGEGGHAFLPLIGWLATLGPRRCPCQPDHTPRATSSSALGCLYISRSVSLKRKFLYLRRCRRPATASGTVNRKGFK